MPTAYPASRHSIRPVSGLCALLLFSTLASAPAQAAREPVRLGYTAYAGGIGVMSFELAFDLPGGTYAVEMEGETRGLVGSLFSWRSRSRAEGRLEPSGPRPDSFESIGHWRGEPRRILLDWDEGGVLAATVEPDIAEEEREPVPPALLADVLDPLSAAVGVFTRMESATPCTGTVPVYDGRRRYDLTLSQKGRRVLADSSYSAYAGETVVCEVGFTLLAGRTPEDRRRERDGPRPPTQVLLAPVVEGLPPLPVRVEAEGRLGTFILHLDRIDGTSE